MNTRFRAAFGGLCSPFGVKWNLESIMKMSAQTLCNGQTNRQIIISYIVNGQTNRQTYITVNGQTNRRTIVGYSERTDKQSEVCYTFYLVHFLLSYFKINHWFRFFTSWQWFWYNYQQNRTIDRGNIGFLSERTDKQTERLNTEK